MWGSGKSKYQVGLLNECLMVGDFRKRILNDYMHMCNSSA